MTLKDIDSIVKALADFLLGGVVIILLFLLNIVFSTGDYAEVRLCLIYFYVLCVCVFRILMCTCACMFMLIFVLVFVDFLLLAFLSLVCLFVLSSFCFFCFVSSFSHADMLRQVTVTVGTTLFALSFIFADSAKNVSFYFLVCDLCVTFYFRSLTVLCFSL